MPGSQLHFFIWQISTVKKELVPYRVEYKSLNEAEGFYHLSVTLSNT
jgi:hypothetical protein